MAPDKDGTLVTIRWLRPGGVESPPSKVVRDNVFVSSEQLKIRGYPT